MIELLYISFLRACKHDSESEKTTNIPCRSCWIWSRASHLALNSAENIDALFGRSNVYVLSSLTAAAATASPSLEPSVYICWQDEKLPLISLNFDYTSGKKKLYIWKYAIQQKVTDSLRFKMHSFGC